MITEKGRIFDGMAAADGGVDGSGSPSLIKPNCVFSAQNVTLRSGFPETRPKFMQLDLVWTNNVTSVTRVATTATVTTPFAHELTTGDTVTISGANQPEYCGDFTVTVPGLFEITSITRVNKTATVTTAVNHGLFTGDEVEITGATQTDYNGSFIVTVTGGDTFTYTVNGNPATPATGTISILNPDATTFTITVTGTPATPGTGTIIVRSPSHRGFDKKRFQGASYYKTGNGEEFLVVAVGGRVYRIHPEDGKSIELSDGQQMNPNKRVAMVQVDKYLVISDGQSNPWIYEGANWRQSNGVGGAEVPPFTAACFAMGRLWVASRNQFWAGDIIGGDTSVLSFTENTYLNEGGAFSVPSDYGNITSLRLNSVQDAASGMGVLLVFTENSVNAVEVPVDRDVWKNLTYPVQRVALFNYGAVGQNAVVIANGDMYFRAKDGVRSFYQARREYGTYGNTPISGEIDGIIENDADYLLKYGSAVLFDGRMLMTAGPVPLTNGAYHRGLVAMDLGPLTNIAERKPPTWEGVWTGINPQQLVTGMFNGSDRCFSISYNSTLKENEVWEITKDWGDDDDTTVIPCWIECRSMTFDQPASMKRLETGDIWVDGMRDTVTFTVRYRPDQYPCWVLWNTWSDCATKCDADTDDGVCRDIVTYQPQYRPRIRLPQPENTADPASGKPMNLGYEFQPRIEWSGVARVKMVRLHAREVAEESVGACVTSSSCVAETCDNCDRYVF